MSTGRSRSRTPPRPRPSDSSLHKAVQASVVTNVLQMLPQEARQNIQRLKQESRHLTQIHQLKGAVKVMLTTSNLALQILPDDADVYHFQAELLEIQKKMKEMVVGMEAKEAASIFNVVDVASNLLDLKDKTALPEDRPRNFFRPIPCWLFAHFLQSTRFFF